MISSVLYFSCGRSALYFLFSYYKKKGYKQVYLPDFICKEVVDQARSASLNIIFLQIGLSLQPDISLFEPKDKSIIVLVDYFGSGVDYSQLIQQLRRKRDIVIVGDYAHRGRSIKFAKDNEYDYLVYSYRKHYPLYAGAAIEIVKGEPLCIVNTSNEKLCNARHLLGFFKSTVKMVIEGNRAFFRYYKSRQQARESSNANSDICICRHDMLIKIIINSKIINTYFSKKRQKQISIAAQILSASRCKVISVPDRQLVGKYGIAFTCDDEPLLLIKRKLLEQGVNIIKWPDLDRIAAATILTDLKKIYVTVN